MRHILKIFIVAAVALFAAEASADAQLLKNLLTGSSSTTKTVSEATSDGQAAGAALKSLYSQYKADGKKLDMSNLSNMLNLATLASSVEGLKGTNNKSTFYKDFAKGLVIGSNSTSVMNGITSLVNNVDLSGLTETAESTASKATSALTSALTGASDKATTAVSNATEIASSVSNILNLFK